MAIPEGYRLLTREDVGKTFGVDLEPSVYIDSSVSLSNSDIENCSVDLDSTPLYSTFIYGTFMDDGGGYMLGFNYNSVSKYFYMSYLGNWQDEEVEYINSLTDISGTITAYGGTTTWNNTFIYVKDKVATDPYNITLTKSKLTVKCAGKTMEKDLVVIGPTPIEEIATTEDLDMADGNMVITPNEGQAFSSVTINKPDTMLPENIKKDVNIGGVVGTLESGGGGASLNIHYGSTTPEDTTKLWVKLNTEPSKVEIGNSVSGNAGLTSGVGSLPTANYTMAGSAVGKKIYLVGGSNNARGIVVFDTETNTAEDLSVTLGANTYAGACSVVGTNIYIFGGLSNNAYIYVFNTLDNTIEKVSATLKTGTWFLTSQTVGTKIYLFGGYSGTNYFNTIYEFDTETDTLTTLSATLPTGAGGMSSAIVGTKIYLFGGHTNSEYLNTINVFDTETKTIETLSTTFPTVISVTASGVIGTKVFLFGGRSSSSGSYLNTIYAFDTETNTLETLSITLPTSAYGISSAVVGGRIYLFGGYNGSALSSINSFSLSYELSSGTLFLLNQLGGKEVSIVKTDNIDIKTNIALALLGNSSNEGEEVEYLTYDGNDWS